jgi:site-specific DNA-cytosine methylase
MKVLVACEFSGIVRDAFIARGHDAMSCDLLPTEKPGPHYQGDVFDVINDGWDMMIAHPPCTHLAVAGAAWFKNKQKEQAEALEFVRNLMAAPIDKICIENPVSIISTRIRKPDQIIHPWQFGHLEQKTTCLWLHGLTKLTETNNVREAMMKLPKKDREKNHYCSPGPDRWKNRSRTYRGIAEAMANTWG